MATITATAAQAGAPAIMNVAGSLTRSVQMSLSASLSSGDVIQMLRVPNGALITDVVFIVDALGGGNYTWAVGDGGTAGRYFVSLSAGSTSSINRMTLATGYGYSYSAEDTIDITCSTATTSSAAGSVKLIVTYTVQNNNQ